MIRGVLSGVFWGVISVALVASVVSLLRPLPQAVVPAAQPEPVVAQPAVPEPAVPPVTVPEVSAPAMPDPAPATVAEPAPQVAGLAAPEAVAPPAPQAPPPTPATTGEAATVRPTVAEAPGVAAADAGAASAPVPTMPPAVAPPSDPAVPAPQPQTLPAAPAPDPSASSVAGAEAPALAEAEAAPAVPGALAPAVQPAPPEPVVPAPGPVVQPVPDPATPPETAPDPAPGLAAPRPQPGLGTVVEGGRTDRLPRIGADPAPVADAPPAPVRALDRNARAFGNPAAKPPFAILLLDDPASSVDLAALASGDMALTLVIDPTAPGAADRAALWRDAGQEVALLTNALPERGRQSDYEVALESLMSAFPQALAFVDAAEGGLQGDRTSAAALVPGLAARGMGLVTWDRGLNAADQVARREGLPAAVIFRELDAGDEAAPVIRRYLDRAAFKAQQDGRAMVLGRLRPETVAALAEWALDGRAAGLALAPASALLTTR